MPSTKRLPDPVALFGKEAVTAAKPKPEPKAEPKVEPKSEPKTVPDGKASQLTLTVASNGKDAPATAKKPATVSFPDKAATAPQAKSKSTGIDNRAAFSDVNAATGKQIDAVLKHYNSPHAGKGEELVRICKELKINPVLMLAIMQQESSYGNRANLPTLKDENIANPWSVHFNEGAKGIAKLRHKDGSFPSFEESLRGAIATLKRHSGDSATPLSTAGKKYSTTPTWAAEVISKYNTQAARIAKMK